MENPLEKILKGRIEKEGPINIADFIALALGHTEHGYYMTRDPFGPEGDFTTSAEVSQMFGEIIGAWIADIWMQMGQPRQFTLLECGPGRGTLMKDAMRATQNVRGFHQACRICLLEMSPVLKKKQMEMLSGYSAIWVESLHEVPAKGPIIAVANEFLDALPVRQFFWKDKRWHERMVSVENGSIAFMLQPVDRNLQISLPSRPEERNMAMAYEWPVGSYHFISEFAELLKSTGGAALFIDYGYNGESSEDTLQAVRKHRYHPVLKDIGNADITTHVNFRYLGQVARKNGLDTYAPVTQAHFLTNLGIRERAQILSQNAADFQLENIQSGLKRLIDTDQMGQLFKVMGLSYNANLRPAGF